MTIVNELNKKIVKSGTYKADLELQLVLSLISMRSFFQAYDSEMDLKEAYQYIRDFREETQFDIKKEETTISFEMSSEEDVYKKSYVISTRYLSSVVSIDATVNVEDIPDQDLFKSIKRQLTVLSLLTGASTPCVHDEDNDGNYIERPSYDRFRDFLFNEIQSEEPFQIQFK